MGSYNLEISLKEKTRYCYDSVVGNVNQWSVWDPETNFKKNLALMGQPTRGGDGDREGEMYRGGGQIFHIPSCYM